jgi:hypothetical protein
MSSARSRATALLLAAQEDLDAVGRDESIARFGSTPVVAQL